MSPGQAKSGKQLEVIETAIKKVKGHWNSDQKGLKVIGTAIKKVIGIGIKKVKDHWNRDQKG